MWHADFENESNKINFKGDASAPTARVKAALQLMSRQAIARGESPTFLQRPEQYTSSKSFIDRSTKARTLTYNAKIVKAPGAGVVGFAVHHPNGDWSPPRDRANKVIQRDINATINQGYEFLLFAFGKPRSDELSFAHEIKARATYAQLLRQHRGSHDAALHAFVGRWLAAKSRAAAGRRTTTTTTTAGVARALYGVAMPNFLAT